MTAPAAPYMEELLACWDMLRREAADVIQACGLSVARVSPKRLAALQAEIDAPVGEHRKTIDLWLERHGAALRVRYPLPRVAWVESFVDLYWDSEGIPRQRRNLAWWDWLAAIMGPRPATLPDYVPWRAVLHRHWMLEQARLREDLCAGLLTVEPGQGLTVSQWREPLDWDAVDAFVETRQLYSWWWRNFGKLQQSKQEAA